MNNLYRELAPITDVAWAEIEQEATRTFKRHIAGRRVVDVSEPGGPVTAAVSTGHLIDVAAPGDGVVAHLRDARPLVRLRVPFTVNRIDIDDVERGSQDSDWDPVKDAAKKLAFIEDRAIFEGYEAAHIGGIRKASSCPSLALPEDPREIPEVISQALSELRLAGVDGPYSWWSWRGKAFDNDAGWRIDYQLATPDLAARVASVHTERPAAYALRWSDHCPVTVDYA